MTVALNKYISKPQMPYYLDNVNVHHDAYDPSNGAQLQVLGKIQSTCQL